MSILPLYLRPSEAAPDSLHPASTRRRWLQGRINLPIALAYLLLAGVFGLSALLAHIQSF